MNLKIISIIGSFLLVFTLVICFLNTQEEDSNYNFIRTQFHSSLTEALSQAKNKNLPVLAFFHAPWCPFSGASIENSFFRKNLKPFKNDFVFLQIDMETDEFIRIKKKYNIVGTARVVFINSEGDEIGKVYSESFETDNSSVLRFFAKIGNLKGEINPNSINKKSVLEALTQIMIHGSGAKTKENLEKAESYIDSFSQRFPKVSVRNLRDNIRLKMVTLSDGLSKHSNWILNELDDSYWAVKLLQDENFEVKNKKEIAEKILRQVRSHIAKEKKKETPDIKGYYKNLLSLYEILGRSDKELWQEYEEFVVENGNRRSDQVFISHAYTWNGHYKDSLRNYDKLLSMAPNNVSLKVRKARVLIKDEQFNEAVWLLENLLPTAFGENLLKTYLFLFNSYKALGNIEKAKTYLEKGKKEAVQMYGQYLKNSKWYARILEAEKTVENYNK